MDTPKLATKRISIVGAGPGGLTCARILQQRGIPVTVYDRDANEHARNQGGSLDLHEDDGQLALREAGLLDEFFALARFEGQEMRQLDTRGRVRASRMPEPDEKSAPEIDRGQLRDMLLRSLEPGTVQWGCAVESVSGPDDGPRLLTFADGTTVETDLVIGADGASSCVREAVSPATSYYSGVSFLEAWFDDMETAHPELVELVGGGSAMATDCERALFAQRNSGGHMRVYIARREPLNWIAAHGLRPDDTEGIRAHLLHEFAEWSPETLRMITDNDGAYVDRPLFVLPAPHTWDPSSSVTLLGDAAHLMPPAGVGVNLAMLDASELALALAGADSIDEALRAYESTMLPRSSEHAVRLDGRADFLLDMGGPDELAIPSRPELLV
ncbi:NAD(P)/FAD-dependent oxidoreductase [Rhodococcus sp. A14]|uniref:FAD-dependent monooxygenase n=1 Tax=Rhodococcus sp. A14 TaxID=1194106 RepID=UPI00142473EC|nr:FAD-dependent monooxygenase [Rhodococcus sp. A14]